MGRFFTYCWQHGEMLRYRDGAPVGFAYGSQFARRGICPDDEVYIVSVHRGRVYLLGKMLVRVVTHCADDFRRYAGWSLSRRRNTCWRRLPPPPGSWRCRWSWHARSGSCVGSSWWA